MTTPDQQLISRATADLQVRRVSYDSHRAYYEGEHPMPAASKEFENPWGEIVRGLRDNQCPRVVDVMIDRLEVTGVAGNDPADAAAAAEAWDLWQDARMALRSKTTFEEAAVTGDGYLLAWVDPLGRPTLYPQMAGQVWVLHSTEEPGKRLAAVKVWVDDSRVNRVTVWTPERVAQYTTGQDGLRLLKEDVNLLGRVPMVHLPNGRSELADVVPLQNLLNKSLANQFVAGESFAMPQRYGTGIDLRFDADGKPIAPFTRGSNGLWISPKDGARFGQFDAASPAGFIAEQEAIRSEIARITATPAHLLLQAGSYPSGEALRTAEASFVAKVRARQLAWGDALAEALAMGVQLARIQAGGAAGDLPGLTVTWRDPESVSELERVLLARELRALGVPLEEVLRRAGYDPERAKTLAVEAAVEADAARASELAAFDSGFPLAA